VSAGAGAPGHRAGNNNPRAAATLTRQLKTLAMFVDRDRVGDEAEQGSRAVDAGRNLPVVGWPRPDVNLSPLGGMDPGLPCAEEDRRGTARHAVG
jgi:hypothetical protein